MNGADECTVQPVGDAECTTLLDIVLFRGTEQACRDWVARSDAANAHRYGVAIVRPGWDRPQPS